MAVYNYYTKSRFDANISSKNVGKWNTSDLQDNCSTIEWSREVKRQGKIEADKKKVKEEQSGRKRPNEKDKGEETKHETDEGEEKEKEKMVRKT